MQKGIFSEDDLWPLTIDLWFINYPFATFIDTYLPTKFEDDRTYGLEGVRVTLLCSHASTHLIYHSSGRWSTMTHHIHAYFMYGDKVTRIFVNSSEYQPLDDNQTYWSPLNRVLCPFKGQLCVHSKLHRSELLNLLSQQGHGWMFHTGQYSMVSIVGIFWPFC